MARDDSRSASRTERGVVPLQRDRAVDRAAPPTRAPAEQRHPRATPQPPPSSRGRTSTALVWVADVLALVGALLVADTRTVLILFVVAVTAWHVSGLYARRFTISILDDAPRIVMGATCAVAVLALVTRGDPAGQLLGLVSLVGGVVVLRSLAYALVRERRRRGHEVFETLILGSGPASTTLARRILEHPETGLRLVGWLHEEPEPTSMASTVPHLGHASELKGVLDRHPVSDVIVCGREDLLSELVDELRLWGRSHTSVHAVPTMFELHLLARATDEVWGVPLESVRRPGRQRVARLVKRLMDVVMSVVALLLLTPVLVAVALAVRAEVGSRILYRQERIGLEGRRFFLVKFRSIPEHVNAETRWSVLDESRIGPVGRFIRRYSLDEIPQLFNVVKGDMSLVGPRPERPVYVDKFDDQVAGYRYRHRVPVGITGLAAVKGLRGATSLPDRVYFDNLYIENWSLWLDVKILVRTVSWVLRGSGS